MISRWPLSLRIDNGNKPFEHSIGQGKAELVHHVMDTWSVHKQNPELLWTD